MLFCARNYKDEVLINEPISLLNLFGHLVAVSFFLFFGFILIKVNLIIAILLLIVAAFFIFNLIDNLFVNILIINYKNKRLRYKTLIPFFLKELDINKCNKLIIYNSNDVHVGQNRIFEIKGIHVEALLKENLFIPIATFSYNNYDHTLISIKDIKEDAVRLKEIFMNFNLEIEVNIKEC